MAAYAGTRTRDGVFSPRRAPDARVLERGDRGTTRGTTRATTRTGHAEGRALDMPRRSVRGVTVVRARRRQARVGYVMIGIVVAFLLGLFSLSQTVRVSAMDYDLNGLIDARQQLGAAARDLRADLARLGGEPAIRRQALDAGLSPMVEPVVVPAH